MPREKFKNVYDAECYPNFNSYIFKDLKSGTYRKFVMFADRENNKRSINDISDLLDFIDDRCDWLIGYNSLAYDDMLLRYLLMHANRLRKSTPQGITAEIYTLSNAIIKAQNERRRAPETFGIRKVQPPFRSLDLIHQYNVTDRTSLKQLAIGLKWAILEDLPFPPNHIVLYHQISKIEHYNKNDVDITEKLMYHLADKINYRIAFTKKLGVNVINSCNADIGKKLIAHYYSLETGIPFEDFRNLRTVYDKLALKDCISPRIFFETKNYQRILDKVREVTIDPNVPEVKAMRKKKQFEQIVKSKYVTHTMGLGGIHSNGPAEILEENDRFAYIDIDARSFYPWIIINDNLYPAHLGPDFVPVYKKYIVEERMRITKSDPIFAYMLKIAANATFGLTKSVYSWLYDPRIATYICVSGQLYLLMLMEAIEKYSNCVVVYSNTDGLTVRVPRNEIPLFYMISERWMQKIGLELEYVYYKRMILRDVNNFIMFSYSKEKDKAIKAKGAYLYEKDEFKGYRYPIVAKAIQDYYNKKVSIEDTVFNTKDIYEFMASEKTSLEKFHVTLFPREDRNNPSILQKNNRWIVTDGHPNEGKLFKVSRVTDKKTAIEKSNYVTVINDVHEVNTDSYKLDYNFYISQAKSMINLTKVLNRDTHIKPDYVQGNIFQV